MSDRQRYCQPMRSSVRPGQGGSWLTSEWRACLLDPQDRQCPMAGAFVLYMPHSDLVCKPIVSIYTANRACLAHLSYKKD